MRFAQAHLSSLLRSLWMAFLPSSMSTAPLSLVSLANLPENLLRVHSIPLSMSPTRMLNSKVPNTNPRGMQLVTDLHVDIELLTTTVWLGPSRQFLIHWVVHLWNPYLSNLETKILCGTVCMYIRTAFTSLLKVREMVMIQEKQNFGNLKKKPENQGS